MGMAEPRTLSLETARRIALRAQGFDRPRPDVVTTRHLNATMKRLAIVQIDSVNVLTRSQYLPFFSRLGAYDTTRLDALRDTAPRTMVEYWAHEASLVEPTTWPLLRHRMARAHLDSWDGMRRVATEHPDLVTAVEAYVNTHQPATARAIEAALAHEETLDKQHWGWNWSLVKSALEHLFWAGRITSAGRTTQFERRYASLERVLPKTIAAQARADDFFGLDSPDFSRESSNIDPYADDVVALVRRSAQAMGVGTELCLRDYFRLKPAQARAAIAQLEADGELEPVRIAGWDKPAWRHVEAKAPRRVPASALLSPFDSLIWQRERTEALWGMRFRLEIYTPAAKREFGYYVLPFLHNERLVARVDLKADRGADVLRANAVHWEPDVDLADARAALLSELDVMATWLGLSSFDIAREVRR